MFARPDSRAIGVVDLGIGDEGLPLIFFFSSSPYLDAVRPVDAALTLAPRSPSFFFFFGGALILWFESAPVSATNKTGKILESWREIRITTGIWPALVTETKRWDKKNDRVMQDARARQVTGRLEMQDKTAQTKADAAAGWTGTCQKWKASKGKSNWEESGPS